MYLHNDDLLAHEILIDSKSIKTLENLRIHKMDKIGFSNGKFSNQCTELSNKREIYLITSRNSKRNSRIKKFRNLQKQNTLKFNSGQIISSGILYNSNKEEYI